MVAHVFDFVDRWGFNVGAFASALAAAGDVDEIVVKINSPGGSAYDGAAMYNTLVTHPAPVKVEVHGLAGSAASVIAMAGDQILMGAASRLFIHEPWMIAAGPARILRKYADDLESSNEDFIDLYAQQATKLSRAKIAEMLREETELSAKQSVSMGFATGMLDASDTVKAVKPAVDPSSVHGFEDLRNVLQRRRAVTFRTRDDSRPELSDLRAAQDNLNARMDLLGAP